jgi:hypothetical protein
MKNDLLFQTEKRAEGTFVHAAGPAAGQSGLTEVQFTVD